MFGSGSMKDPIICLPEETIKDLNLTPGQRILFKLGLQDFQVQIKQADGVNDSPCFLLNGRRGLGLLPGTKVQLSKSDRGLELGPLLGILCSGNPAQLHWTELELARYIIRLGQELGIVPYLVSPDSLDIDRKQAFGYTVKDEDRTWYLEPIPFPAVFYNRVYTLPNPEAVIRYNLLLTLAEKDELKIYNRSRLDKWRLHQLLQGQSKLEVNVPQTKAYTWSHLVEFSRTYPFVYLKPCSSSLSKGLIRISDHAGEYLCEYYNDIGQKQERLTQDPEEIAAVMEPNQDYLVQQGIDLASIEDRPVDFRVHVHKDGEGIWQLVCMAGRLGALHGVSTRPSLGGSREPAPALLGRLFPGKEREYMECLTSAALSLAQYLDTTIETGLGELGIDLGFDSEGRLWLFEANERPSGYHFLAAVLGAYKRQGTFVLEYSRYLSNIKSPTLAKLTVIDKDQ